MTAGGRYDVSSLPEAQAEPGSRGRVLRNLLGVKRKREMDRVEASALVRALEQLLGEYEAGHRFTAEDARHIHRVWLGEVYEWAGEYRRVNLAKGDLPFAAAAQIPRLMGLFSRDVLAPNTPCRGMDPARLARALAEVHAELILIHPFREGNGRSARVLAVLMAAQAGFPPLDFSGVKGARRVEYFAAVRAALDRDYTPMERVFAAVLRRTCRDLAGAGPSLTVPPRAPGRPRAGAPPRSRSKRSPRGGPVGPGGSGP